MNISVFFELVNGKLLYCGSKYYFWLGWK